MFKIRDGREYFYQWDINREIIVNDPTITEVHFCNRTDDCSLVVEVKEVDGLRIAEVPNILLQDNWKIRVYAYCGYTKVEELFTVKPRTKPADYVYTETEVLTYKQLEDRLDEIEANGFSEEVVNNAVNDYFEKNPITMDGYATEDYVRQEIEAIPEVDLTGYATETYVNQQIDKIPELDLSNYYNKNETNIVIDTKIDDIAIPTKVSHLANDANYATQSYVDTTVENHIPDIDLSNYYTKPEIDTKLEDVSVDAEVQISDDGNGNVTIESVEGSDTPSQADLSNYYTKEETEALIPTVPTKVSELDNDKGYISNIPSQYVTETELASKGYIDSLEGYATEDYVDSRFRQSNQAIAFDSYSVMINEFNTSVDTRFNVGQNIYIRTLEVPDLWISAIEGYETYTYINDAQVINELAEYGYIQVGYFRLSALETQKVDLTNYYDKEEVTEEIDDAISNKVVNWSVDETNTSIDLSVLLGSPITIYSYTQPIININKLESISPQGMSVQFKSADAITVASMTNTNWIGDDCADNVFTPQANTNYEVYSYYHSVLDKVINMVMNLGA